MRKYLKINILTIIASLLLGCNTSDSESQEEKEEDRQHEELLQKSAAYALSPENVARQAAVYSPDEGGGGGSSGGFLWKPVSESDGNLVVLLPSSMKSVSGITVRGSGGSASTGRHSIGNGNRPHYRFGRSGGSFGHNITVSGGGKTWHVSNGGSRTEL